MVKEEIIAELSIIPVGTGDTGLSQYIAACLDILEKAEDIRYQLTAMGTIIQGSLKQVFELVRQMHEVPFSLGVSRAVTTLRIDDRRDKLATMESKVDAVLKLRSVTGV